MDENQVVEEFSSMVRSIVHKLNLTDKSRFADMYQSGLIGLIKACREFDETKNVPFRLYAYNIIRWTVLLELNKDKRKIKTVSSMIDPSVGHLNTDTLVDFSDLEKNIGYDRYVLKKSVLNISKSYGIDRRKVNKILRAIESKA